MFGRKKRGPPVLVSSYGSNASSAAHTAATSAFLKSSTSNASLSATAAAAAALRSRPTSPTVVGEVQTRRIMRRTNSTSSIGSSAAGSTSGPPGAQLERRGSSGSMTERTFRDPSPNRGPAQQPIEDVPPVPAIPKNIPPPVPAKSHKRAASMETAVARMTSPLPNLVSGRGSSLEHIRSSQPPPRSAQRGSSLSSVQELTGADRPSSRGSVNFSYPTGPRECSPYGQRQLTSPTSSSANQRATPAPRQNLVYDRNSRRFVPESDLLFLEQSIRDTADRPVKTKKKVATSGAAGTHLADGTIGGRIHGTAVDASGPSKKSYPQKSSQNSDSSAALLGPRTKRKASAAEVDRDAGTYTPPASEYDSDNSERSPKYGTRSAKPLVKRPSIVREDREQEEAEDEINKVAERQAALNKLEAGTREMRNISPSPQPRATNSKVQNPTHTLVADPDVQHQRTASPNEPRDQDMVTTTPIEDAIATKDSVVGTRAPRVHSISPVRVAHFLSPPESLAVRHQPLERSVSPMKSALKHSPSSRGSSPNGDTRIGLIQRGSSISDASDVPAMGSEEPGLPKKKLFRVSFDDESNTVLGESDVNTMPDLQTTPGKRGWFPMGRGKKKDLKSTSDDSEIMTPRPDLPFFGSVREKKYRDSDDRSLVTPVEPVEPARAFANPPTSTTTGEDGLGSSGDHAVGALIALDQASKQVTPQYISNEPLPPEVTSVEGSGYISDDVSSTYSVEKAGSTTQSDHTIRGNTPDSLEQLGHIDEVGERTHQSSGITRELEILPLRSNGNGKVPTLALTRPSPTIAETQRKSQWRDMPGQFPESSDSSSDGDTPSAVEHHATELTPAALGIAEPDLIPQPSGSPKVGEIAIENTHSPISIDEETEDSDNDSIYSDAAEDFSDMQGDGFMSLDAVVDSPITGLGGSAVSSPTDSPSTRNLPVTAYEKSGLSTRAGDSQGGDGRGPAQQYRSGGTTEGKIEAERAARVETDDDSVQIKPGSTVSKGKTAVVNTSTKTTRAPTSLPEPHHSRTYQIAPGARAGPDVHIPALRSSMRTAPVDQGDSPRIRKSMRTGGAMRDSIRESSEPGVQIPQQKASLQKKYRPRSTAQAAVRSTATQPKSLAVDLPNSSASTGSVSKSLPASRPVPTLRRKGSNESDSSFKRARPASEGYRMKRSLRGAPQQSTQATPQSAETTSRSGRYTLRSLSPSRPTSPRSPPLSMPQTLRHTRRFSDEANYPTLRSSAPDRSKSPMKFPGFGRSKPQSKAQPKDKVTPSRASRFADSSDEEEARPSFRSRFVDSSDEEENSNPLPAAKARPTIASKIARRNDIIEEDSSDLPDTDDEKTPEPSRSVKNATIVAPANAKINQTDDANASTSGHLRRSGSGREFLAGSTTITSISATPPTKHRHGSFMSILRRKKPDPSSKVRKSDIESAARRDTPLERSRADLIAVKRQDSNISTVSEVASPKLLKRSVPTNTGTRENWPLPSTPPDLDDKKGETPQAVDSPDASPVINGKQSDTVNGRPDLGSRQSTATALADVDLSTVTPTKKKKRFPMLRKAFRLDV